MGVQIVWDNPEKTTLRYDLGGDWAWEDLKRAIDEVFAQMDASPAARIDAIAHFTSGVKIPSDTITQIGGLLRHRHPKAGLTVVVGAGRLLKMALSAFKGIAQRAGHHADFEYADTLDEARSKIAASYQK